MIAIGKLDEAMLSKVVNSVLKTVSVVYKDKIPKVEEIQDIIEVALMKNELFDVSKSYILYRNEKAKIRDAKKELLGKEALDPVEKKFSLNSLKVLASRYLLKNEEGGFAESVSDLFKRVTMTATLSEVGHDKRVFSKEVISDVDENRKEKNLNRIKELVSNLDEYERVFSIGDFVLTKYHFETLMNFVRSLVESDHFKVDVDDFLSMLKNHEFDERVLPKMKEVYGYLVSQDFMPNTPALINGGRKIGMLSACFTLNMEDDLNSILDTAKEVALIQKAGGGNGINFSKLRPKNDFVGSTMGVSSGPVSFMNLINAVSEVIKQGGVRRGANMGILNANHPDVEEFVKSKEKDGVLNNFNISVGTDDYFWDALYGEKDLNLINPRTKKVFNTLNPRELLDLIAYFAWSTADPGMLFFDNANRYNVLIKAKGGRMDVTNPCGEEPLYPYESCNLASINLANFVVEKDGKVSFDWERYHKVTRIVARVLDNMIDVNKYPLPKIDYNTKLTRRVGVGIMGLAEALFKLGIKYNSKEGFEFMSKVSEHLTYFSYVESVELSKERGTFPIYEKSDYVNGELPIEGFYNQHLWTVDWTSLVSEIKKYGLRNAMVTTNPPTGSVSMISDTTSGIEPVFALVFEKRVLVGNFYYVDSVFETELRKRGLYSEKLIKKISDNYGSVQGLNEIPDDLKKVFVTSMDIHWVDHVVAQSILQKWITDSISKTINMSADASVDDVKFAYVLAHDLHCKGVTVYRDGSKYGQVLNVTSDVKKKVFELKPSKYGLKLLDEVVKKNPRILEIVDVSKIKRDSDSKLDVFISDKTKEDIKKKIGENSSVNINNKSNSVNKSSNGENNSNKVNNENKSGSSNSGKNKNVKIIVADKKGKKAEDVCPICGTKLVHEAGCNICPNCGWSECVIS